MAWKIFNSLWQKREVTQDVTAPKYHPYGTEREVTQDVTAQKYHPYGTEREVTQRDGPKISYSVAPSVRSRETLTRQLFHSVVSKSR